MKVGQFLESVVRQPMVVRAFTREGLQRSCNEPNELNGSFPLKLLWTELLLSSHEGVQTLFCGFVRVTLFTQPNVRLSLEATMVLKVLVSSPDRCVAASKR